MSLLPRALALPVLVVAFWGTPAQAQQAQGRTVLIVPTKNFQGSKDVGLVLQAILAPLVKAGFEVLDPNGARLTGEQAGPPPAGGKADLAEALKLAATAGFELVVTFEAIKSRQENGQLEFGVTLTALKPSTAALIGKAAAVGSLDGACRQAISKLIAQVQTGKTPDGPPVPVPKMQRPEYGKEVNGLALGVALASPSSKPGEPMELEITLRNIGLKPLTVYSHVAAQETHLDWFTVTLTYPVPGKQGCAPGKLAARRSMVLVLQDAREKSAPVKKTLKAGDTIVHRVDLTDWAAREINQKLQIAPGFYRVQAIYNVLRGGGVWTGQLRSGPALLTVEGAIPEDRCQQNPGWDKF